MYIESAGCNQLLPGDQDQALARRAFKGPSSLIVSSEDPVKSRPYINAHRLHEDPSCLKLETLDV